ncbi:MAG: hypothetical protein AAF802_08255 [Planctomycetota bacterium]
MDPINLAPLTDAQNRFRRDFTEFARLWQEVKADWRDEPARQFEKEYLQPIGPRLTRLSSCLAEFTELLRKSQQALQDTDTSYREVY